MAIACLGERAPCLPRRTCSISSCTNSPAAVVGLLPRLRSCFALRAVLLLGIRHSYGRSPGAEGREGRALRRLKSRCMRRKRDPPRPQAAPIPLIRAPGDAGDYIALANQAFQSSAVEEARAWAALQTRRKRG